MAIRAIAIRQDHIQAMVDAKAATPSAARNLLNLIRALMVHAIDLKLREDNPAIGVKRPRIKGKGFRSWKDEHCAKFEAKWPLGTRARLAYELLSCTGLRSSDIVRVGRQHIRQLDEPVIIGPYTISHEIALANRRRMRM
jgi:site-specific recombinase XerD